ncbi:MAG: HNH endonuclease [bacterium]
MPREFGGSEGWRGTGWKKAREIRLELDKHRSRITGFDKEQGGGLFVDHIHPFRLGGKNNPHKNLRTVDRDSNWAADFMRGARERPAERDERW